MTEQQIIGKGTWIDKLAQEMITREKSLGRNTDTLYVESGLGASGIPHIGSLGDAVRAYGVKLALQNLGYASELVAYSDDLDGLRKIPEGIPDSHLLEKHIAKPVSMIPDPFGCHDSYGMHMSSLLLDGLDRLNIKYQFRRAYDTYSKGILQTQIHQILTNRQKIGAQIQEMVGQEKYQTFLPYYPVCANCGKLYTAQANNYIESERKVSYKCTDTKIGGKTITGCTHIGEADITKDLGKLAWKVEFAARWSAFDIRFEAYGKDIMDSVKVNDWVADNILHTPHPHHIKYEMFLDRGGKKISKSLGNVITSQRWLRYGSPESILLLLYKRITGARELGFDDIPHLMDEYNELENIYFGKTKLDNQAKATKLKGLYEYVNLLNPPKQLPQTPHVSYQLLVELAKIFKENRTTLITKKLIDYHTIKQGTPQIIHLIELAGNYADDFKDQLAQSQDQKRIQIEINSTTKAALNQLAQILISLASSSNPPTTTTNNNTSETQEPLDIQNTIYQTAKSNDIPPKDFFQILYQIILGTTKGPKIGPFICDIGLKKVGCTIQEYIQKEEKE